MVVLPAADQDIYVAFNVIRRDPIQALNQVGAHIPLPSILVTQTSRQIFITQHLSHNVCHTLLITQYLTYCIFHSLCNTDCVTNKEQFGPTSSLSLAALASASAFCFSASAWCFILLFLECTELAALLVVSRTLK